MSADTYTEVTSQGWFSRIGGAIKGILVGIVMVVIGVVLLWFNEGRAVRTAKGLKQGAAAVVTIPVGQVDLSKEGRLVHMTGEATTSEQLADPDFGVSSTAIALRRQVEMYQWKESSRSEKKKKLGGSEETVTTYTYEKAWSSSPIDSSSFKRPDGHSNPGSFKVEAQSWRAAKVTLGAYTMSPGLVEKMTDFRPVPLTSMAGVRIARGSFAGMTITSGVLYLGASPSSPQVGDIKVSFSDVKPAVVSIVARQVGDTFEPFITDVGTSLEMLDVGAHSADSMFKAAIQSNRMLTWILRAVGFFLIFIGVAAVLKPLSVLADVAPFLGNLVGFGTGLVAFLIAVGISALVVAVAWLVYRPLLAIALFAVVIGVVVVLLTRRRPKVAMSPAGPPPLPRS
jgi:hypothetical protein